MKTPAEELTYLVPVLKEMNAQDLDAAHGGVCAIAAKVLQDQQKQIEQSRAHHCHACSLGCEIVCKADLAGCPSECLSLPWRRHMHMAQRAEQAEAEVTRLTAQWESLKAGEAVLAVSAPVTEWAKGRTAHAIEVCAKMAELEAQLDAAKVEARD